MRLKTSRPRLHLPHLNLRLTENLVISLELLSKQLYRHRKPSLQEKCIISHAYHNLPLLRHLSLTYAAVTNQGHIQEEAQQLAMSTLHGLMTKIYLHRH